MKSILDAMLAQYVDPYVGDQGGMGMQGIPNAMGAGIVPPSLNPQPGPQMGPQQPGPQQPTQPMQPQPQQQAPQPPQNPLEDVESALMSGMNTPEMQASSAFEEGVAPFEDKWRSTQERRFGGWAGGIEGIADMVREKKLRPQRQAVDAQRARMTQEALLKQADQKYKDAKKIIGGRNSKLTPDEVDAMARLYAQGEDLAKLAPDKSMDEYQRQRLAMDYSRHEMDALRAQMQDSQELTAQQKKEGMSLFDKAEPVINSYNSAQNTMQRLLAIKDRYGENPGPAGINAMYDFIKSIDPDSVVREGEVRLTEQGQGYMTRIQHMMEQVYQDQVMPEDFLSQVVNMAQYINEDLQRGYAKRLGTYYNLATQHEIPHNLVFGGDELTGLAERGAQEKWAVQEAEPITADDLNQTPKADEELSDEDLVRMYQ